MNLIGKMLDGRYEILEKVGNGGMAMVYKAKDQVLNRYVAIKILRDEFTTDSEFIKRFRTEAQSAAGLAHPNIVQIYDVGAEDNLYYIVMELLQGKTLKEIIDEDGSLSWKWSVNIAMQIASALETAHKNGIIHRDIKPHNIIITEDGIAKVTDFGIAKAVSNSTITAFGTTIGSVHYFSPEHARGGFTDAKSDLYSLGVVMYEMLTGRVPFDADTPVSVALKQVQEEPVEPIKINDTIPLSVNRIVLKAMQKDPNNRYNDATEMLKDLKMALKRPNEDFVVLATRDENSPTQKVPTIYEIEMEKNNEKHAPKIGESETHIDGIFAKFTSFLKEHTIFRFFFVGFLMLLLFVIVMLITIHVLKASRPAQAEIPNLVYQSDLSTRLTKEQAEKLLKDAGFTNYKFVEDYSDVVEAGYVVKQDPEFQANYLLNLDKEMTITVSKGKKMITLPIKMVGEKIESVKTQLDTLEAKYEIQEINDEQAEVGVVLEVSPEQGEEIESTTTVVLKVSKGSAYRDLEMQNVLGKTEAEARKVLSDAGFTDVAVSYTEDTSKNDGVVTKQNIDAGATIKENEKITLTVNKLPEEHTLTVKVSLAAEATTPDSPTKPDNSTNNTTNTSTAPAKPKSYTIEVKVNDKSVKKETVNSGDSLTATYTGTGRAKVEVYKDGSNLKQETADLNTGDKTLFVFISKA
ncbi:MAG: Stk1 family PASTA domain-containing Ser/Thr kinase [Clostridia bacterium]|nr:Stk1 family PASTA domain-containing Ser/Thr kinase [Clostridia bacterium]